MILEISTTHTPATDLGYLLHKNPTRVHEAEMNFGTAWVYFPEVHECAFGVLAMESEPVDPRL